MLLTDTDITTMAIVAHPDDDLFFMNPDIQNSIASGQGHVTVFMTAGNAGQDESYWGLREDGIKAAYAEMAGADDWVDTEVTLSDGENTFTIASSYLESQPDVRLYFMRMPDGKVLTDEGYVAGEESLEALWEGEVANVSTVDGANTFTGNDVTSALLALMDHHQPEIVMTQDHETEHSFASHSDHLHGTLFVHEAYQYYDGGEQLIGYLDYHSILLDPNVSDEDHEGTYEAYQAYAEYDPNVPSSRDEFDDPTAYDRASGWVERQYYTDDFESVRENEGPGFEQDPALASGDNPLFVCDPADTNHDGVVDWGEKLALGNPETTGQPSQGISPENSTESGSGALWASGEANWTSPATTVDLSGSGALAGGTTQTSGGRAQQDDTGTDETAQTGFEWGGPGNYSSIGNEGHVASPENSTLHLQDQGTEGDLASLLNVNLFTGTSPVDGQEQEAADMHRLPAQDNESGTATPLEMLSPVALMELLFPPAAHVQDDEMVQPDDQAFDLADLI